MWPSVIEVQDIGLEHPMELFLLQDQEMIQAFAPHASQKAFTDDICSWRPVRRSKHVDTTCCCHSCKILPECAIIIPDQIFWGLPIRSGLSQLLRNPGIGGRARHIYMDDLPRLLFNDEERKERTEEEIRHLQKITGPDLCRMVAQEGFPFLSTNSSWASKFHILLNRPFDFSEYPA